MTSWAMILMALLGGDPGTHLLDYASTEAYWKSKSVGVSVESMTAEIKGPGEKDVANLIVDLSSPDANIRGAADRALRQLGEPALGLLDKAAGAADPEVSAAARAIAQSIRSGGKSAQVRRLMAIRTLGELGDAGANAGAIATLQPLLESKEMFVAEYAARSIARLQDKPYAPKQLTHEQRLADVWMLPAQSRLLLSTSFPRDGARISSIDQLIDKVQMPALGNNPPPDRDRLKQQLTQSVLMVADKVGDVRIDHIAFGLSGEVGKEMGFASLMVRGEFDAKAVNRALAELLPTGREAVGGFDVYRAEVARFFVPSNTHAVAMLGAAGLKEPLEELTGNLAKGSGKLSQEKEVADLVNAIEGVPVIWGVIRVTPTYRQMVPDLAAFDSITMVGLNNAGGVDLNIRGRGGNPADIQATAKRIDEGLKSGLAQIKPMVNAMPAFKPLVEIMESTKITSDAHIATMTARVNGNPTTMLLPLFFGVGMRAEAVEVPAQQP